MLKLPYYLACSLMLVESMTITMCLAIEAIVVCIIYLLLDASFVYYNIARHVSSEYLD
jgi:hypothetical protein